MKRFLSSSQVADELGMTRDALNAKIRADAFIAPDVVIGDRFQGWDPSAVAGLIIEHNPPDAEQLAAIHSELRRIAEHVRTYSGYASAGRSTFERVPRALYELAGTAETMLREVLVRRHAGDTQSAEPQRITVPLHYPPSLVLRSPPTERTCATELQRACAWIDELITRTTDGLPLGLSRRMCHKLARQRDAILVYLTPSTAEPLA